MQIEKTLLQYLPPLVNAYPLFKIRPGSDTTLPHESSCRRFRALLLLPNRDEPFAALHFLTDIGGF